MPQRAIRTLAGIGALASLLLPPWGWAAAAVAAVPLPEASPAMPVAIVQQVDWQGDRLLVKADRRVVFRRHELHDPERLIVDVLGADEPVNGLPAVVQIHAGVLIQARIARHPRAGFLRVVVDLAGPGHLKAWQPDPETLALAPLDSRQAGLGQRDFGPPAPLLGPDGPAVPDRRGRRRSSRLRERAAVRQTLEPLQTVPDLAAGEPVDEAEGVASHFAPWPARPQVVDRLRIHHQEGETVLVLHGQEPLMAWLEQDLLPPRLTVRLPRASVTCQAPLPRGLVQRVDLRRQVKEWDLSVDLPNGLYLCDEESYDQGRGLEIKIRRRPQSLRGRPVVVIDPGHGGVDPGTSGPQGHSEKEVALQVATKVAEGLEDEGYDPVLTRTIDTFVRLPDRAAFMSSLGAVAFVSLHCNSSSAPAVDGIETYYRQPSGEELAKAIQRDVVKATGRVDRGIRQARLYVLEGDRVPGSLIELGFLTNPREERRLCDPDYQETLAHAIAHGVRDFLSDRPVALRPAGGARRRQPDGEGGG